MSTPYSRVYLSIITDPRFATVYDNDARLACWLRLLLMADAAFPAPVPIPVNVNRKAFRHLVDVVGLVNELPGRRYEIHGMALERRNRSKWGSDLASNRAQKTDHSLNGPVERVRSTRRDETRQDETRRAPARDGFNRDDYETAVRAKWQAMGLPVDDA